MLSLIHQLLWHFTQKPQPVNLVMEKSEIISVTTHVIVVAASMTNPVKSVIQVINYFN